MPILMEKKWLLAFILAGRVTVAAGFDLPIPYPENPEGLPPLCSPKIWGQEVYASEFRELPPESLIEPISLFQKQYAAPAFLAKRERVRALLLIHPEVSPIYMQPSLASDTLVLLKLNACLESWRGALENALDEPINDLLPVKERPQAFTAWATLLDRQAGFVRERIKAWLKAEQSTPQTVVLVLQAFEAHLSARSPSGSRTKTSVTESLEKIAKGKYRRNIQLMAAISLLRDFLPALRSAGGRTRHLCLKSRIQELTAVLALPLPTLKEKSSDFERQRALKSMAVSIGTLQNGLKEIHEWKIPIGDFTGMADRVNGLVLSMSTFQNEIIEKPSHDDDWQEFTERMLSRFADFSEEVKEIAREVAAWKIDPDSVLPVDDADSCELLFRNYHFEDVSADYPEK